MIFRQTLVFMVLGLFSLQVTAEMLTIEINGIKEQTGKLRVEVLSSQAEFDGEIDSSFQFQGIPSGGSWILQFGPLPAGEYAIRATHDVNGDNELNTNFIGIPSEPWAMSGQGGSFGPPSWKDSKFELNESLTKNLEFK